MFFKMLVRFHIRCSKLFNFVIYRIFPLKCVVFFPWNQVHPQVLQILCHIYWGLVRASFEFLDDNCGGHILGSTVGFSYKSGLYYFLQFFDCKGQFKQLGTVQFAKLNVCLLGTEKNVSGQDLIMQNKGKYLWTVVENTT